jgi:hypothetical protein
MKNNKGLVIITIILGVLVLGLGVYITYDKILKEEPNVENDNNSNTNDTINKENTSTEQNTKKSTLLDKTKIEKYKNGDGSYGTQKSFVETNYNTHLSLIGEVKYKYKCLNNHVAASYVIARRGLKYKELVPKKLKNKLNSETLKRHHWKHWSEIKKLS